MAPPVFFRQRSRSRDSRRRRFCNFTELEAEEQFLVPCPLVQMDVASLEFCRSMQPESLDLDDGGMEGIWPLPTENWFKFQFAYHDNITI